MVKSEYKEANEKRDYWYDKSIMHRSDDNDRGFERYDRPIGSIHMGEEYDSMSKYEDGIKHFID